MKKARQTLLLISLGFLISLPIILVGIEYTVRQYNRVVMTSEGFVMLVAHTLLALGTFMFHFKQFRISNSTFLRETNESALDDDFVKEEVPGTQIPKALRAANVVYGILASFLFVRMAFQVPFRGDWLTVIPQYIGFTCFGYVGGYVILSFLWKLPIK